jgi:type I restriction enzyme R subunit
MSQALSDAGAEAEDETFEDKINRLMEARKLLPNASYFAFTATPKNKTLEIFGEPDPQADGTVKHHAFHTYSMKQAIQEGFILDVLAHYTPVESYYKLAKTVEDDPEFDANKARKKLRRFVEGHDHAIRLKAEIMVDHFHDQVLAQNKIGGQARAMVVTNGIERAVQYYHAFNAYLKERKSKCEAIVAFSGEHEFGGQKVSEASLNGFPSGKIAEKLKEEPYRFLICADKFQTGYDEPLLHTMYVDKTLSGIKAVQTLSRLNRAHPKKHDVFVLDFLNDIDTIRDSFAPFYRATVLADETDPNKLHDLQADLDGAQVYSEEQINQFVRLYLGGADREQLDPILDACVAVYMSDLDEDGQVDFKGKAKGFVRTYGFLSSVLPYTNAAWEKRSIFLNFLVSRLPSPKEEDLSKGILDAIDMDSYRAEKKAVQKILLADEDAEIESVPVSGVGYRPEPELDRLSNILKVFNDHFGDIPWEDADRVRKLITETIPARVAEDSAYKNAQENSDKQNARIEHDAALVRVMTSVMKDDTELFKQFVDNKSFKRWMTDTVFGLTFGGTNP